MMDPATNQLILAGEIMEAPQFDHEVFGEAFFRTILSVPRLSGAFDLLPVTVSERLMADGFEAGMQICVSGQLRSYNKVMGGQGRLLLTAFSHRRAVQAAVLPHYALWPRDCRPYACR